jgi:hypothetical protein
MQARQPAVMCLLPAPCAGCFTALPLAPGGRALLVLDCWLPAPCTREVESGLEIRARDRAAAATPLDRDSRTWRLGDSCSRRSAAGQVVRDTPTGRARVATCKANWAGILLAQDGVGCGYGFVARFGWCPM